VLGWPAIASREHVLIQAPTGSGKTLTAFLSALDRLNDSPGEGLRVLYVSPLKALNYDIERNLRGPLAGLESKVTVAVRTGDTSQKERRDVLRHPPDILITTPESLFLMLTSQARDILRSVDTLILDEVHAVAGTKRGAHMAISVERLDALAERPIQRIGLSATQRPLEEIGRFVSGAREIRLIDAGTRKELDLEVVVPVEDMRELGSTASLSHPAPADGQEMDIGTEHGAQSIWPSIYPEILRLVRAHKSTIVFVNNRRLAERLALRLNELAEEEIARAHHGSLAREQRVLVEEDLKAGRIPCLVATSSLELGIDMGAVDLVVQVESPKSVARARDARGRDRGDEDPAQPARRARAADRRGRIAGRDQHRRPPRARHPRVPVPRALAHAARERARHARRPLSIGRVRGAATADHLGPYRRRHSRTRGCTAARRHERRHDPGPRPVRRLPR
jgi:ATP-dependent helicase Lhr and Lhr-like helicase